MENPYSLEDCKKIIVNEANWILQGYSRAGQRTGFILYPHKFIFDCGLPTLISQNCTFITHSHTDHTMRLPEICSRNKGKGVNKVYTPFTSVEALTMLERCVTILSDERNASMTDKEILEFQKIDLIPVKYGEQFIEQNCLIEILEGHHSAMSVGYGIQSIKRKLQKKYGELSGREIKSLIEKGIDVYEMINQPELAFYCDTTVDAFLKHEEWKKYPVIVCECTGIDIKDKKSDKDYYDNFHTRITQLYEIFESHKNKHFILIHISSSADISVIKQTELDCAQRGYNVTISY